MKYFNKIKSWNKIENALIVWDKIEAKVTLIQMYQHL